MLSSTKSTEDKAKGKKIGKRFDWAKYGTYIIFVCVFIFFTIWQGSLFFSLTNILNITRQTAMISVMAVAMTFIIAGGGIDLSMGAVVAMSAILAGFVLQATNNVMLAVVVPLLFGATVGALNGVLITKLAIPPFLATLGLQVAVRGVAMWSSDTKAIPIYNKTFTNIFGYSNIGGVIPSLLFWTIAAIVIGDFALKRIPFGKKVLAVGGNIISAKYTGIKVNKIIITTFIISGVAAAFAGLLYTGRMETARYTFGEGVEMDVVASVVLGGTSMRGGTASIMGAFVGSLLMGTINNGLIIGGLTTAQQMIAKGIIIVASVAIGNLSSKRA